MILVERVQKILTEPSAEWTTIESESTSPRELYTGYIMPLSAIGPIAMVIGLGLFGISMPLVGTVPSPGSRVTRAAPSVRQRRVVAPPGARLSSSASNCRILGPGAPKTSDRKSTRLNSSHT